METKVSGSFDDIFYQVQMKDEPFNESFKKIYEGLQYGKGSNPPTEKDEEIAEKFCILMDWEITPDDIWQVYDYGDGKATISVTKDMTAAMTDGEVSDLDDVYYYDYENDCIISKESEDLAKMQDNEDDFADQFNESITPDGIKCDCCGENISPNEVAWHSDEEGLDTCFDCEEDAGTAFIPKNWEYEDDIYEHDEDDYEYEDDFTDKDMGEMYGNYRGDASFFESKLLPHERIMEATIGERLTNTGKAIKDGLNNTFKQIYEGQTTFINHIGEKDSFDDPYNTGKSLAELDAEARMDDVPADSVEYWYKRLSKGLNFDTPEGLAESAEFWEGEYFSDTAHDLAHDGGRLDAQRYSRALQMIYNQVVKGALNLGLTSSETTGALSSILARTEKLRKNKDAAAKRKATMAANAKNRVQSYIEELRNADLPAEVRELFADDGYYKERRSYGVIKNYFDKPYGKALKAVWKDQFAN